MITIIVTSFIDIDECSSGNGGCQQICVNTNGSYHCTCQTGFSLNTDNSSCSGKTFLAS